MQIMESNIVVRDRDVYKRQVIARADAQAWSSETDEYISISKIEYDVNAELGEYPVVFSTANGTAIERKIIVVDQRVVKNEKANEAVMAFNFFKTVDELSLIHI